MYQCILNVPLWNDWSKVTYSQVNGSLVLKTISFQILSWISAIIFAKLIQFGQDPKIRRPRTFWRESLAFHWRKISYFYFTHTHTHTHTHIYIYIHTYIYVYSDVIKTIRCAHPPHHHNEFVVTCQLWIASSGVDALLVLEPTECSSMLCECWALYMSLTNFILINMFLLLA